MLFAMSLARSKSCHWPASGPSGPVRNWTIFQFPRRAAQSEVPNQLHSQNSDACGSPLLRRQDTATDRCRRAAFGRGPAGLRRPGTSRRDPWSSTARIPFAGGFSRPFHNHRRADTASSTSHLWPRSGRLSAMFRECAGASWAGPPLSLRKARACSARPSICDGIEDATHVAVQCAHHPA